MSKKRAGAANLDDLIYMATQELKQRPYKDVKRVLKMLLPEVKIRVVNWDYGLYSVEYPDRANDNNANLRESMMTLRC